MKRTALAVIAPAIIWVAALAPAWAQDPNAGDAPDHGVARLSVVQGNVSMRHGDMGELSPAAINAPLVTTDRVVTGDSGRAEVQFDFTNMIRLAPSTEVRLSELEFQKYQVQIAAGTTSFRVLQDNSGQVEISTPTVSVRPVRAGTYRVSVRPDGITEITVRSGQAEIYGPQGSENLGPGQTMDVRGTINDPEFQTIAAIPLDDFDRWNQDRDKVMQQTSSYRPGYVPPDVTGGESLDPYGQWQTDPTYGNVWVPSEPSGWAPYQAGRWVDEDYYGWTWVSADPWGWAPYHYGAWYESPWGWAWWPGGFGHHYWRPALVGFFGWGPGLGIGVGFGFGHVGWVPLAPFEVYHPWYGGGLARGQFAVANVNVVNTFRNARVNGAVSSVRTNEFGHGTVSGAGMIRPTNTDLARAGAVHGALPVSASAGSRRVSDGVANTRGVPQTTASTRFATRAAMPNVSRGNTAAPQQPAWRSMNGYNANGVARGNTGSGAGGNPGGAANGMTRGPQSGTGGGPSRGGIVGGGAVGSSTISPRNPEPRNSESNYRYAAPQNRPATQQQPQQQPLRMNPPIVQQRSAPAPAAAPRSGGGGGGSVSRPGGGGGGGGSVSHGGGGGGGHSGGGGRR